MAIRILVGAVAACLLLGCATEGSVGIDPGAVETATPVPEPQYPAHHHEIEVPPGHIPPIGMCRLWYPDRSPSQQPPPGECNELRSRIPVGVSLIRGG